MLYFKVKSARSWLSDKYGKVLSHQLANRLVNRCKGEKGVFITLTYQRDEYESPRDLYREAKEQRHVRRFIERLSLLLGESLSGRWLCKLEFQRGGWVHWHLLVLGVEFIDHAALTETWGHGFVFIKRMSERNIRYTCKYVSKDGELPSYLYLEPIRSVKIVRVSPGFWLDTPEEPPERDEREPTQKLHGCYVCIGELIERSESCTVVRDDVGRFAHVKCDAWSFLASVQARGGRVTTTAKGWLGVDGITWEDVADLSSASAGGRERAASEPRTASRCGDEAENLYLSNGGNPPTMVLPKWLMRYFHDLFGWRQECIT